MAQLARNSGPHLAAQILLYPVLDLDMDRSDRYPSLCENAEGYHVTRDELRWCVRNYLPAGMDPADPRISPAQHADLTGLPATRWTASSAASARPSRSLRRCGPRRDPTHPGYFSWPTDRPEYAGLPQATARKATLLARAADEISVRTM